MPAIIDWAEDLRRLTAAGGLIWAEVITHLDYPPGAYTHTTGYTGRPKDKADYVQLASLGADGWAVQLGASGGFVRRYQLKPCPALDRLLEEVRAHINVRGDKAEDVWALRFASVKRSDQPPRRAP